MQVSTLFFMGLAVFYPALSFEWTTETRFDHFTKRVSPDIYSGGLLTTRQIEYLAAMQFGSVVSVIYIESSMDEFNGVNGSFPSSMEEIQLAKDLGMSATYIESVYTKDSLYQISTSILRMPKPIYIHCQNGYSASLFAHLHLFQSGALDRNDIYLGGLALGWDYHSDFRSVSFIHEVTALPSVVQPPSIEQSLAHGEESYKFYYWAHRVGSDLWYNAGQVLDTHVETIARAGYVSVISFRANHETTTRLPRDGVTGPIDNNEFSDADGYYNVTAERLAFEAVGVRFYHLPIAGDSSFTAQQLAAYRSVMTAAAEHGPVLGHCTVGYRSLAYIVAYLAQEQHQCTPWALTESRRAGFSFDQDEWNTVTVAFFQEVLGC